MTLNIGQTVARKDPGGHETMFNINNAADLKYHTDLLARGYQYTVIAAAHGMDFDLPNVDATPSSRPRVHIGGDTCVSCEG